MSTRTALAIGLALCLTAGLGAKTKSFDSQWLQVPVTIDGMPIDWGMAPLGSNGDLSIDYSFQNDAENLYVIVTFNDPRYLSTINLSGMTIWFNPEGKNKRKLGIKFMFKMVPAEALIQMLELQRGKPLSEEEKGKLRLVRVHEIKQCYLAEDKEDPIPVNHPFNPQFEARRAGPKMTFEFRIPYRYLEAVTVNSTPPLAPGKALAVGFEWGGMTDKMRAEMLKNSGERLDSGNRRADSSSDLTRTSERFESGSLLDEGGSRFRGPKKYDFWVLLKLAQQ